MHMNVSTQSGEVLAMLAVLFGIITTIFWMVVGWRAMRAHERLADAAESAARTARETVIAKRQE
jgi:uncharacterized membrane protein